MKLRRLVPLALAAFFSLCAAGCSTLPIAGQLPHSLTAEKIADIDEGAPFAIAPDSIVVAHASAGLKLLHIPSRQLVEISPQNPQKLAWSPAGYSLAASYYGDGKSSITTYDQHGIRVAEAVMEGQITDLAWLSEDELLAASIKVTNYKFGSNFKTVLHRWLPGRSDPTSSALRDTTLQTVTARRWETLLARGPMLDLSRAADQILYLHPNDPPLFTPYYKLILRDLASGRELDIAQLDLNSEGGRFSRSGEELLYGDGSAATTRYNPWTEETLGKIKTGGKNLQISPSGGYWFADGALYRGDTLVTGLAPGGVGRFTPDGKQLIVAADGNLYLLSGLQAADEKLLTPEQLGKLVQLRTWRIEGLITAKEYRESLARIKQP